MARIVGLTFPAPVAEQEEELKTKAEIKAHLDELGIEYPSKATLAELKALIPQE